MKLTEINKASHSPPTPHTPTSPIPALRTRTLASTPQRQRPCKYLLSPPQYHPTNLPSPPSYRYDVADDGTFNNRQTFAYVSPGIPDGIHCDSQGNVYAGCGDGVHVFNPAGQLLGKIYLGTTTANFRFVGKGRMVICAETKLYFATLAAEGADPEDQY